MCKVCAHFFTSLGLCSPTPAEELTQKSLGANLGFAPPCCVQLGKSLNFSEPGRLPLQNGGNMYFLGGLLRNKLCESFHA